MKNKILVNKRTGYLILIILISFLFNIVAGSTEIRDEEEGQSLSDDKEDDLPPLHGPRIKDIHDWTVEI